MLTGPQIQKEVEDGRIYISDFTPERLNPNSYNLRLAREFIQYDDAVLDMKSNNPWRIRTVSDEEGILLHPNKLYLGRTVEYTSTPHHIPRIDGRSSIGRLGIFVHVTAGFGDIGFCGRWTLELVVAQPIRIYPYTEICQISYHQPIGEIKLYNGRYQNSAHVEPSKFWQ